MCEGQIIGSMEHQSPDDQSSEPREMANVIPVESPSENYFVVEHLNQMPSLFSRGLIYLVAFLLVAGLIYTLVGKVDIAVECRSVACPLSHEVRVLSDQNGYIEAILVSDGQPVEKGAPLYMDITVENKDIRLIAKGMDIQYKFEAFPYTDYGILTGRVFSISPYAKEDRTQKFVYHVKGTLSRTYFEIKEKRYNIMPGMTAAAELVTDRKSIFSILFNKL